MLPVTLRDHERGRQGKLRNAMLAFAPIDEPRRDSVADVCGNNRGHPFAARHR